MEQELALKKNNILIVVVVFVGILILYAVFNQIDSVQKIFSEKDFHPATFETHNAFYLIWALAEPPGTDILSNEVIARYRVPNLPNQWNQRVEGRQTGKGWPQKKYRRYHNMFR